MYEPKIEVVRAARYGPEWYPPEWYPEDGAHVDAERAYLVRGLPMPGEKVRGAFGRVRVVAGLKLDGDRIMVRYTNGGQDWLSDVLLHDPEAERLRVATEAVRKLDITDSETQMVDIARAVLDALKEVDDG